MYDYKKNLEPYDDSVEIDLKNMVEKLIFTISRYWIPMLLSIVIICELVLICSTLTYKQQYTSYITYVVNKSGDESTDTVVAVGIGMALQETFETSGLKEMIESQYEESPEWLNKNSVVPTFDEETNLLTLTMSTDNYYNTKSLSKIVQNVFPEYVSQMIGTVDLSIIDQADAEKKPSNHYNAGFYLIVGILVGGFVCGCFTIIMSVNRKTIRRKEDMKTITRLKCLEEIPLVKIKKRSNKNIETNLKCTSTKIKNTIYGQSVQSLRQKVEKIMLEKNKQSLMITSSIQGEGKSITSANLAILLSQRGYKVMLIDADLYHPTLTKMFDIDAKVGLVDYLNGKVGWEECVCKNLPMDLLVGKEKKAVSSAVLLNERMENLLRELKEKYDIIIVDTPPAAYMADANYISKQVDAMLYVVRHDYTNRNLVEEGLNSINQECAEGIGYILNAVDNRMRTYDKYGYRKYGYKSYSLKEM